MGSEQPSLQQRGDAVDARQEFGSVFPSAPRYGDLPIKAFLFQPRIALPAVSLQRIQSSYFTISEQRRLRRTTSADIILWRPEMDSSWTPDEAF